MTHSADVAPNQKVRAVLPGRAASGRRGRARPPARPGFYRTTTGDVLPDLMWWGNAAATVLGSLLITIRTGPPEGGGDAFLGAATWSAHSSGTFVVGSESAGNRVTLRPNFPGIKTSPRVDLGKAIPFLEVSPITALSAARQVRELQTALSVNKSELARILRVSRPTVYDWLDDGEPNAENIAIIRRLLRLLTDARVSSANPLYPQLVRLPDGPGRPALIDLLREEPLDEAATAEALYRAKAMGDAIDRERNRREAHLRFAGFEDVDAEQRKAHLASNTALLDWPRE